jgi:hypothetical protein
MDSYKKQYQPGERVGNSGSAPKSAKNDNWIFFTALLISLIFWILIKLSDSYTIPYSLRVNYKSIPAEKRLTFITDSIVNVNITARGYEILHLNLFGDMDVLDINLSNFSLMKKEGDDYYVYTDELTEKLAKVTGIPKKNIHFSKNTLSFTLTALAEKELRVENLVRLGFTGQFELYEEPLLSPETVKAFGPAELLDSLDKISTEKKVFENINSNRDLHVKLFNPLPDLLKLEPDEVTMKIRVEKFTTSSIEIPIEVPKLRQNIKLFPKTVTVHFKVAQKDYNNVRMSQFEIIPDLNGIDIHTAVRLHLTLVKQPAFIRNISLEPADVEFLIIR